MHVLRNFRVFKGPEWSITDQQADSAADHITPTSDSSQSSSHRSLYRKKSKGSPYSITERRVPELIPVLGSQPSQRES